MDGTLITWVAEHFTTPVVVVVGGAVLWRHITKCDGRQKDLHTKLDAVHGRVTDIATDVAYLKGRSTAGGKTDDQ